jgi:hypothetical protein
VFLAAKKQRCSQNLVVQETNKIPIGVLEEQMNAARVRTSDPDPALPGNICVLLYHMVHISYDTD